MEPRGLVIGCGNIGALYDFDTQQVRTHAKAYQRLGIPFEILDQDAARASRVAARYQTRAHHDLSTIDLSRYQIVSLCSNTETHAHYLDLLLAANVPLIFCEKPVAATAEDLLALRARHAQARSVVLVNYMRRFLAPYQRLRDRIREWQVGPRLRSLVIRYHRGFLNNAGHALDLMEFLFDRRVDLDGFAVLRSTNDAFQADPTLTASFDFEGAPVLLLGFPHSLYPIFDLELNFDDRRIQIADLGDRIVYHKPLPEGRALHVDDALTESGCLDDYMLPVFETGLQLWREGKRNEANFDAASRLNLAMVAAMSRTARPR